MGEPRVPPLNLLIDDSALIMLRDVSLSDIKCWNGGHKLVAKTQRWAKMG